MWTEPWYPGSVAGSATMARHAQDTHGGAQPRTVLWYEVGFRGVERPVGWARGAGPRPTEALSGSSIKDVMSALSLVKGVT